MLITFCVGKIHRAMVTAADLDYESSVAENPGQERENSITIDENLVNAAGFFEGQLVKINSLKNGVSWETYIIKAKAGSGEICLNGPPAHHFAKGDMVIILAYGQENLMGARDRGPTVVFVNKSNKITKVKRGTM